MKRTTYGLALIIYFCSILLGILNVSINFRSGKARINPYITIYNVILTMAAFGVIPYFALTMEIKSQPAGSADLDYKCNISMTFIRIAGVLITFVINWTQRHDFIRTFNKYQRFRVKFLKKWKKSEEFEKYFNAGILSKYQRSLAADLFFFMGAIEVLHDAFEIQNLFILLALAVLPTLLNTIMTHYYIAVLNTNILMRLLNGEIKRVLNSTDHLCKQQHLKRFRPEALTYQCCQLANELEDLAMDQYKLQNFNKSINRLFDVQGTCAFISIYLFNICLIYMVYNVSQHPEHWNQLGIWTVYIVPVGIFLYYMDYKLFVFVILNAFDLREETAQLLRDRQHWSMPNLDERLEKSLKNFSLQLASIPLEMDLMGLFEMQRPTTFAILSSTILNAIVLIQYDFKYSKKI